jgi:nucleoside-diphosphate-sugar epimerase
MHTILGAGGTIATELLRELLMRRQPVRLASRHPAAVEGATQIIAADLSNLDQTIAAVVGSTVVYLLVGLKYDIDAWRELWPRIMRNTIEACKRTRAKMIFFDNVYMYGKVNGPMTEETPFRPTSRKGEVRAEIAGMLLKEMAEGRLRALIARSADFYGPNAKTSVANILVFDKLAKREKASWLVDDSLPHSFTFTPDAARSLAILAQSHIGWGQTWHVPTAPHPPTGKQFIAEAASASEADPRYRTLGPLMLKLAGLFNSDVRELYEMLYQYDSAYVFDSTKFTSTFRFAPTAYDQGIRRTAAAYASARPLG